MPRKKKIVDYNKIAKERAYSPEAFDKLFTAQKKIAEDRNEVARKKRNAYFRDLYHRKKDTDPAWLEKHRANARKSSKKAYWKYHDEYLERHREQYKKNAEKIKAKKREQYKSWTPEQKAKHAEECRMYRKKNAATLKAKKAARYNEHKEEICAKKRAQRKAKKELKDERA